jgi:hypothetical protein
MFSHITCRTASNAYWTRSKGPSSLDPRVNREKMEALERGSRAIEQLLPTAMPCLTQLRNFTLQSYHAFLVKDPELGDIICFPPTEFAKKLLFTLTTYNRLRDAFRVENYDGGTLYLFLEGLFHVQYEGRFHYMHLCSLPTKLDPPQDLDGPNIHPSFREPATENALLFGPAQHVSIWSDASICVDAGMPWERMLNLNHCHQPIAGGQIYYLNTLTALYLAKYLSGTNEKVFQSFRNQSLDFSPNILHLITEYTHHHCDTILPSTLLIALYRINEEYSKTPFGLLEIVVSYIDPIGSHMPPRHIFYDEIETHPYIRKQNPSLLSPK